MHILKTVQEVRDYRRDLPSTFRVGFVPTMGCLHMGHASLMKQARAECSKVIVSIYVNPTQFAANEDFTVYPRTWEEDRCVCEAEGVDAIFLPSHLEMYPRGHEKQRYYCEVEGAVEQAEGRSRPHHFRAVATVCLKLFNIVLPSDVYFGQKDAMQCAVIRSMIVELNVPVIFHVGDTVRESDGLALSSRNKYLSPSERRDVAPYLYKALLAGRESIRTRGEETTAIIVRTATREILKAAPGLEVIYVALGSGDLLEEIPDETLVRAGAVLSVACRVGTTRLIDNLVL